MGDLQNLIILRSDLWLIFAEILKSDHLRAALC